MISPEETADMCLNNDRVKMEDKEALFFKDAVVIVFDGLIIWRGSLNMEAAIDRLHLLAKAVGLPVAVVEGSDMNILKRKKTNPGKFVGPYFWDQKRAWDSINGLDPAFWSDYDKDGIKKEAGKQKPLPQPDKVLDNKEEDDNLDALYKAYMGL